MSEPVKSFLTAVSYWKMAILKCACQCILGLGTVLTAALQGAEWSTYSGTQKFLIYVACAGSIATTLNAFCSTTMADLQGDSPTTPKTP